MPSRVAVEASRTPLVDALRQAAEREPAVFHTPGHKRGRWAGATGVLPSAGFPWAWDGGDAVWAPGFQHRLSALVDEVGRRAAEVWGAQQTWLLWNGATAGVLAMVLAAVAPGGVLALPREAHLSAFAGLVLSGAWPVFVPSRVLPEWGLALPPSAREFLEARPALEARVRAGAPGEVRAAVLSVSPTYYGIVPDLPELARRALPWPLLVDEAHGSHLPFAGGTVPAALPSGAYLVSHGVHKTLFALTQAGLLHMGRGPQAAERLDGHGQGLSAPWPSPQRVTGFLAMVQSTSPQPALLASLDELQAELRAGAGARVADAAEVARAARQRVESAGPFRCLRPDDLPAPWRLDESRLVVDVSAAGVSGFEAYRFLVERQNVWPEMADGRRVVFIFTGADDEGSVRALEQAFRALYRERRAGEGSPGRGGGTSGAFSGETSLPPPGEQVLSPRQAVTGAVEEVAWEQAEGRVSADLVTPYPPGVPLVIPGERVTREAVRWAIAARTEGAELRSLSGRGAFGLQVVCEGG